MSITIQSADAQVESRIPTKEQQFAEEVRRSAKRLKPLNERQLQSAVCDLRETLACGDLEEESTIAGFAFAYEALRRTLGVELYNVQLMGAHALVQNRIAEMQTGEGKTFTAVPAAVTRALTGQGVHVANPNAYLAERDHQQLQPAFELLGITTSHLPEQVESHQKKPAYRCDVTYGTGYEFGFDYLRDQLALREFARQELGTSLIDTLSNDSSPRENVCQRGLVFAIVDEADNVLIDDASSPLVLSQSSSETAPDAEATRIARYVATRLKPDVHFRTVGAQNLELTEEGRLYVHRDDVTIPVSQLLRPWTSYVEQALRAERLFRRDVHYIVQDKAVQIVDGSTGRIFSDRTWQGGLHQAVEAKERLEISAENETLAQITRQRFYRLYQHLSGMTGTATNCERELQAVYNLSVQKIPPRLPSKREILPTRFFASAEQKWRAISTDVRKLQQSGRPVLIGTRSIAESDILAGQLRSENVDFQMLNGQQDADEATIVAMAGDRSCVTIATNLAGRGTDIKISGAIEALGGLHVIVSECHESARVDRQLVGRSARQGQAGSAQSFVSADDWLLKNHGEWLAAALRRDCKKHGEVHANLESRLRRIQQAAERAQYAARAAMFRRDLAQARS